MKRDMELIREILLSIEAGQKDFDTLSNEHAEVLRIAPEKPLSKEDAVKLEGHLDLLEQAGLIEIQFRSTAGNIVAKGLTWQGHEWSTASATLRSGGKPSMVQWPPADGRSIS